MRMLIRVLIVFGLLLLGKTATAGSSVTLDKSRTVVIKGTIVSPKAADTIFMLTLSSNLPIDIVLSSPGGVIDTGLIIGSAIKVAQARGIVVRCHVPVYAASIAFYLLTQCSERYALGNSFLIFHQARIVLSGLYSERELKDFAESLITSENYLKHSMQDQMHMNNALFEKHHKLSTTWQAADLVKVTRDGFLKIVDDIINVPASAMFNSEDENLLSKLLGGLK